MCYQCGEKNGEDALAWDLGEIYGLANPTRLPSPTTCSLARTVVLRPHGGTISRLGIRDAERAQGLRAGHTAVAGEDASRYTEKSLLKARFRCVGNALPGMVGPPAATHACCVQVRLVATHACCVQVRLVQRLNVCRCLARSFGAWRRQGTSRPG